MCALLIAGSLSPANVALLEACRATTESASLLPAETIPRRIRPGDVVLGRIDVRRTLDGAEAGLHELRRIERRGNLVLNRASTLAAAHDKLVTARLLARAGLPHPRTLHVRECERPPETDGPVVVKPRFGSWGTDVLRCDSGSDLRRMLRSLRRRAWFGRHGALVQELVPGVDRDLRLIVAGGIVVGAIARECRSDEWRTNVALGASRCRVTPPAEACALAVGAAAAVRGDLVGVDLLPTEHGFTILEVNGCADFTSDYALMGTDVFTSAVQALLFPCEAWADAPEPHSPGTP
jgi:RimK family alpha-L-glutamate ligase